MDNDLKLLNDLQQIHEIMFIATKKDNKEAAVNNLRVWIQNDRIKIHPRCKHLLYHLEFGQWDKNRSKFKNLPDSQDKTIRGGHVDAVDALIYMVRNIHEHRNPFPEDYNELRGPDVFYRRKKESGNLDLMKSIMGITKNK